MVNYDGLTISRSLLLLCALLATPRPAHAAGEVPAAVAVVAVASMTYAAVDAVVNGPDDDDE